ncbi:hypothetical protein [Actinomadura rayongensis]|uniref:Uncharacterized protein n=1 Tax=Actinomadura rayongensis TaxID=1429076 RepID=A0A6I4WJ49_9ACTN|nr:hypothetical protein [Actinomadura rayongensis]MXQ67726.1 hypothetical protein [Actinomadura rayongensis]
MTHPLRLAALALGIAACGAVAVLIKGEGGGLPLLGVPLVALVGAGLVGLFARAFGHLRRWGLLIGAGAFVAMAANALTDSGASAGHSTAALIGAALSSSLWFVHDVDEAD